MGFITTEWTIDCDDSSVSILVRVDKSDKTVCLKKGVDMIWLDENQVDSLVEVLGLAKKALDIENKK